MALPNTVKGWPCCTASWALPRSLQYVWHPVLMRANCTCHSAVVQSARLSRNENAVSKWQGCRASRHRVIIPLFVLA